MTLVNSIARVWTLAFNFILEIFKTGLDIFLFVLSLKVFPLAWHARSYYSFLFRNKLNNRPVPLSTLNKPTIFQSTIWTSSTPLGEIDIMGHKTNSTYATDFDVARNYHICSLFRVGLKKWGDISFVNTQTRDAGSGLFYPAIAGINFTFHKGIRPRKKYEICTRVLSWDDKWLHLISHFVERGSCKPVHFTDQKSRQCDAEMNIGNLESPDCLDDEINPRSVVFATAMAKIVFKKGRKTVPPADFLVDCGLLPSPEKTSTTESSQVPSEDEKLGHDHLTRIGHNIETTRALGYLVAERLNGLDEGCSFYNASEKVFFSKR